MTDKRFPGNPTRSYRTREPVRVIGELHDWTGHSAEQIQGMREGLAELERSGGNIIYDEPDPTIPSPQGGENGEPRTTEQ
ncbi:hypothetical protein GCM10025877_04090 [Agromyces mangrovi Wang et al. 2018]|nr:hypothetical protein GCM10025877_04090 [Agromyces mangrovi]